MSLTNVILNVLIEHSLHGAIVIVGTFAIDAAVNQTTYDYYDIVSSSCVLTITINI